MKKSLSFVSAVLAATVWAAPTEIKCEMSPAGEVHPQGTTFTFKGKVLKGDDLPADAQVVLDSQQKIQTLCQITGLPLYFTAVRADLAPELAQKLPNVFPLQLQEKYFDLPDQII